MKELKSMASEPKDQHCFILESFKEFEALARRALHQGKYARRRESRQRVMNGDSPDRLLPVEK